MFVFYYNILFDFRLISSTDDTSDIKELTFSDYKYGDKLKVLVQERKVSYESDSETESEVRKNSIKHYLSASHQNDTFKSSSSPCNDEVHCSSDKEVEKLTSSYFLSESQKIYQNLVNEMQMQVKNVENENFYDLQYDADDNYMEHVNANNLKDNTNISSEDLEKYMLEKSVDTEPENNMSAEKDEVQYTQEIFLTQQYNQLGTLYKNSNKTELEDIKPDKLSREYEILSSDSEEEPLKSSLVTSKESGDKQIRNVIQKNEIEITSENTSTDNCNIETKNKLDNQEMNEPKNHDVLLNNGQSCKTDAVEASNDIDVSTKSKGSVRKKAVNYNKEKLLATMRAIDDNENIEFLNQDYNKHNIMSRKHITENLFRGLPTHAKKKQEIIKDIFETDGIRNEPTSSCSKLH